MPRLVRIRQPHPLYPFIANFPSFSEGSPPRNVVSFSCGATFHSKQPLVGPAPPNRPLGSETKYSNTTKSPSCIENLKRSVTVHVLLLFFRSPFSPPPLTPLHPPPRPFPLLPFFSSPLSHLIPFRFRSSSTDLVTAAALSPHSPPPKQAHDTSAECPAETPSVAVARDSDDASVAVLVWTSNSPVSLRHPAYPPQHVPFSSDFTRIFSGRPTFPSRAGAPVTHPAVHLVVAGSGYVLFPVFI